MALMPKLTLPNVLKTFTKAQTQLEQLIQQNDTAAALKIEQVDVLTKEVHVVNEESRKAGKVLENIKAILGEE